MGGRVSVAFRLLPRFIKIYRTRQIGNEIVRESFGAYSLIIVPFELQKTNIISREPCPDYLIEQGLSFTNNDQRYQDSIRKYNEASQTIKKYDNTEGLNFNAAKVRMKDAMVHTFICWGNKLKNIDHNNKEAIEKYAEALQIKGNDQGIKNLKAEALFSWGNQMQNGNSPDYLDALNKFNQAVELNHNESKYHSNKAAVLNKLGRHVEAMAAADEALELEITNQSAKNEIVFASSKVGDSLLAQGKYPEALEWYNVALKLDPSHSGALNNSIISNNMIKGLSLQQEGDKLLEEAINSNHKHDYQKASDHYNKALEKFEEATTRFRDEVQLDERFISIKDGIQDRGDTIRKTLEVLNQAISVNSLNVIINHANQINDNEHSISTIGVTQRVIKNYNEASHTIKKYDNTGGLNFNAAKERWKDAKVRTYVSCGNKLKNIDHNYQEAIEKYDEAIQIKGNDQGIKNLKAEALFSWGNQMQNGNSPDYLDALNKFNQAVELNNNESKYHSNKAAVLNKLGRHVEAMAAADEALELNRTNQTAKKEKVIASSKEGDSLLAQGKYHEALEWYNVALKLDPSHSGALNNSILSNKMIEGLSLQQEGNKLLEEAINSNRKHDYQKAADQYNKALEKFEEASTRFRDERFISIRDGIRDRSDIIRKALEALDQVITDISIHVNINNVNRIIDNECPTSTIGVMHRVIDRI